MAQSTVLHAHLGGTAHVPWGTLSTDEPQTMRLGGVASTADGRSVDLVFANTTEYSASNPTLNGFTNVRQVIALPIPRATQCH